MSSPRAILANELAYSPRLEERAELLGYLGLVPFSLCAIMMWILPSDPVEHPLISHFILNFKAWTLTYSAIILTFLGGVRWGLVLFDSNVEFDEAVTIKRLTMSTMPAVFAWLVLVPNSLIGSFSISGTVRFFLLGAAFIYMMIADLDAAKSGAAPDWYGKLRRKLTFFLILLLLLIIIRLIMWHDY